MYMTKRPQLDSWSTDNCCVKWSLKCGTLFIAFLSLIWCGLTAAWFFWLTYECWGIDIRDCSHLPSPERLTVDAVANNETNNNNNKTNTDGDDSADDDNKYEVDILLLLLGLFFVFYVLSALLVIVGVFLKKPDLLKCWVNFTLLLMILVFLDLAITLAFTTIIHLSVCFSLFVASLYMWAVVRSHMIAIRLERNRIPLPENAVKEYTVDGLDVKTMNVEEEDL